MEQFYFFSFAFIAAAIVPLWYDASRRPEYGSRPKTLLKSIILFVSTGIFAAASCLTGLIDGTYSYTVLILLMSMYPVIYLIVEYSVHSQRIQKNLLDAEFKANAGNAVTIGVVVLVLAAILLGMKFLPQSKNIRTISGIVAFVHFVVIIGFSMFGILLFDLEQGVIRRRTYLFVIGPALIGAIILLLFLKSLLPQIQPLGLIFFFLTLLNFAYAVRVFHEYFLFRMQHLNSSYSQQKLQDKVRTELINKVLVSSPEEDTDIIRDILTDFLTRTKEAISNPNLRTKSMMLFRRNEDLLSVDSPKLIVDYCLPLINQETLKRMKQEMLTEHIMTQIFDLSKIRNTENPETLDFASAAVRTMMETKAPVFIKPLPNFLAQLYKLIVLYPVFNKGQLTSMLVLFKDSSDYIFPQEKVIIDDLINSLSITTMLIGGKQMQEDKNRLNQEMDVAKMIQVSILPKTFGMKGYDIATEMITATEVGGDLFDFKPTQFGNFLDIGDVSGHGLPAGMMALIHMAAFHGALCASETVGKRLETPELYNIVNQVLINLNRDRMGSDKFMTCNILFEQDGTFKHAGSHMIGLIYRAATESVEELTDMVERAAYLGISEYADSSKSLGEFSMEANDVLILYTDGLTESRNRFDEFFGLENLAQALKLNAKLSALDIKKAVLRSLEIFSETGDLQKYAGSYADDVSILVIKRS